jgi:predicted lipoprotein with Yx(FWY)xxD motif
VLTNSAGFTLYWYAPDTSATSKCTGGCATSWPPLAGKPQAASGVTLSGALGTITRSDGTLQATYAGHPLYTFAGDHSAGQATGNGVGGAWHAVTISAPAGASPSPSAASGGGGGGY